MEPQPPEQPPGEIIPQPQYGVPISQNLETIDYLTSLKSFIYKDEDEQEVIEGDIPPEILKKFYAFLTKDIVLTNLNEKEIRVLLNKMEMTIDSYEMSLKPGEFGWETLRHLDNFRSLVHMRLRRALNGMERKLEATQIHQQFHGNINPQEFGQPQQNRGFGGIGRFFGR